MFANSTPNLIHSAKFSVWFAPYMVGWIIPHPWTQQHHPRSALAVRGPELFWLDASNIPAINPSAGWLAPGGKWERMHIPPWEVRNLIFKNWRNPGNMSVSRRVSRLSEADFKNNFENSLCDWVLVIFFVGIPWEYPGGSFWFKWFFFHPTDPTGFHGNKS